MKQILVLFITTLTLNAFGQTKQSPYHFLPKGYIVFEKIFGDLNGDGIADCVLIIKGTDTSKIVNDKYRGRLDRNRRGIIVLLNKKGLYELAVKNYACFSSENEDGGIYFAPELSIKINKGNLYFNYNHGRYGYWKYTFRFQKSDFELIGYDASYNDGPVINSQTSINFITKVKKDKVNIKKNAEGGDEVFKTTSKKINIVQLHRLSNIEDVDNLDMDKY